MDTPTPPSSADATPAPAWTPLSRIQRRILGVLVEKAKTTPNQYPLSLNAITTGCNQTSNRSPQMNLDPDQVEEALEQLRAAGAVGEVHGSGRVPKYRHYCKEWLGVEGTELAVMAELLLRGPQTVGDLRGRAARMATGQLPDINALRPVLATLVEKKLVVELTPAGRGQIVSHNLFEPREMDKVRAEAGTSDAPAGSAPAVPASHTASPAAPSHQPGLTSPPAPGGVSLPSDPVEVQQLRQELAQLREEMQRMRKEIEDLWANLG